MEVTMANQGTGWDPWSEWRRHPTVERAVTASRRLGERAARMGREASGRARQRLDQGLQTARARARERDLLGEAAYRALTLVHDGLGLAVRSLSRLERATTPPARPNGRRGRSGDAGGEGT
jgi:hypothetical protein